jgi:hypothetical protein
LLAVPRNAVPRRSSQPGIPDARLGLISRQPEVALNQKVKNLIQKLGEAIHETVSESEDIAVVVKNIREQGFDVLLMLEATIGLNEVEAGSEEATEDTVENDGPFTTSDLTFLKSLRISVNETNDAPEA